MVKWALVPENYPDHKLTPKDVEGLNEPLWSPILSSSEGAPAPTFEGFQDRNGATAGGFSNKESEMWLESLFPDNKIGGKTLRVCPTVIHHGLNS